MTVEKGAPPRPPVAADPSTAVTDAGALVARVRALVERSRGGRVVVGITGSPGAGKTTLATRLVAALGTDAMHLPMDGFHLANATLDRLGRHDRKGALDTFDGAGFVALLRRVREERDRTVYAPSFHREVDEPVAGEIAVDPAHRVVVVEGNYLLVAEDPWGRVRGLLDEAWFCSTGGAERERRLVDRHTRHGRTVEAATAWASEVDGRNALLVESTRPRADLVVSGAIPFDAQPQARSTSA
ncbi:nucleoside/nucleotide kinase family protein [Cellulosimicrobium protaetiae]|uniref:Nucleoside/nucleotide kinase family protein n=1 Tax=Cellulosimicrobium protaetiae TaxID=2587808 RepID=A0A6M5UFF0_9MICO|nr:nucleoside/nucleotide kinase family protein [Cellulosimicrobium protaetiae]QJW36774.1 nucleoside/nucleotide kinase family protein [Cellulosimicrobium protaetiae]